MSWFRLFNAYSKKRQGSRRGRVHRVESLEDRRMLASSTLSSGVYLDGDFLRDGSVDGNDFLAWQRQFGSPVSPAGSGADADRDGNVDVGDLNVWQANFAKPASPILLTESTEFVVEAGRNLALGQQAGLRTLSFSLDASFDTSDQTATSADRFNVYVIDPATNGIALDDGQGRILFSLTEHGAEFTPGLVRYDGSAVEIDLSQVSGLSEARLVFQLLNADGDTGSSVEIQGLTNTVDFTGSSLAGLSQDRNVIAPGGSVALAALTPSTDVEPLVSNVRYTSSDGTYLADLQITNHGAPQGRDIVVRLSGLPSGVAATNASGVDLAGNPYWNFRPAIANGGLTSEATSATIEIALQNPNGLSFPLQADILAGLPNRSPIFTPLGDLNLFPGDVQEIILDATDPDGDTVTYSLAATDGLPTSEFSPAGSLIIKPAPGDLGVYPISIMATDGALTVTQNITITVAKDPTSTTRISGSLLNTDGSPLAEVPIQVGRFQTTTQSDGSFVIELPSFVTPTETFDIAVPLGDPQFDPLSTGTETLEFRRAGFDPTTGDALGNPRLHPNIVSAFLDASVVYGSDGMRASALRRMDGTGKLKTSPGDLLPINNGATFAGGPLEIENDSQRDPSELFAAGDVRANDNVALTALQTLFVREHNRKAEELASADPSFTGEDLFQQARRWVKALLQHITYNEYLPILLGPTAIPSYTGYDQNIDPSISGLFSGAAFRVGHSMSPGELLRLEEDGSPTPGGPVTLGESFFNPDLLLTDGLEPYLRGMSRQTIEQVDTKIVDELRSFLFGPPGAGGLDLIAINVQRGRDLGLPSYNQARRDVGLATVADFADITSDVRLQQTLAETYAGVDDVDLIVGGLAEDHVAGAMVGELFQTILADQFQRLRDGDRFWFENGRLEQTDLDAIRATTLADVILRNTTIQSIGPDVFTTGAQPIGPPPGGAAAATPPGEIPTFDGSGNNALDPGRGAAGTNILVDYTLDYGDGISTPAGVNRKGARTISNAIFDQTLHGNYDLDNDVDGADFLAWQRDLGKTGITPFSGADGNGDGDVNADDLAVWQGGLGAQLPGKSVATSMLMFWGQLLAHDMALTPGGTDDTIKVFGDALPGAESYPFVAEKLPEILHREVYLGVDNQLPRPIYLPVLNTADAVSVNPSGQGDTMVSVPVRSGTAAVELVIQEGTAIAQDGQPFEGPNAMVSITEVPPTLLPMALPNTLLPEMVVTVQPAGTVFTSPAQITFPNTAGYSPSTLMDIWALNPETGEFQVTGQGRVSADGSVINTISGGVLTSSWYFPAPPPPEGFDNPDDLDGNQDEKCNRCEATAEATSRVELHSGAVRESHYLVTYRSLGATRGVGLFYDSQRADPRPIVHFGIDNANGNQPDRTLVARLSFTNGSLSKQVDGYQGGLGLPGGEHFWQLPDGTNNIRVALQGDLSDLPSGVYNYTLTRGILRLGDSGRFTGSMVDHTGQIVSINAIDSPFGAGWELGGVQRLVENFDDSLLLIDGNGANTVFEPIAGQPGQYKSPVGDFSILVKNTDGSFTRTMTDQTQLQYGTDGRLRSITDRNGNQTRHTYVGGRLTKITDPVGLETIFTYTGDRVTSITDPAGRVTSLEYDAAGNLSRITDPDSTSRSFDYDAQHHIVAETDQLGHFEETLYGFHGRATGAIRKDGSTLSFDPVQTRGLLPAGATSDPLASRTAPLAAIETVAHAADARGNITTTHLDQAGQTISSSDTVGNKPSVTRNADNLVASTTDARGFVTAFTHDDRGNLTSVMDFSTLRSRLFNGQRVSVGGRPRSVTTGDFNGDGLIDLVTANDVSDDVSVLLGRGDGTFADDQRVSLGSVPLSVTTGDFNGDGLIDLVTANNNIPYFTHNYSSDVSVLLGRGDGTFAADQQFSVGSVPFSVTTGDFNGDGLIDLVTANTYSDDVSVLLGRGDGTFAADQRVSVGGRPFSVTTGDYNGDGLIDLVTANTYSDDVSVLLGRGDGTFADDHRVSVGGRPVSVTTGDYNGDGLIDLVTANYDSDDVSVLLGRGDGTFADDQRVSVGYGPVSVTTGDFNGDGLIDLVNANIDSYDVSVLLGRGDGTFADDQRFSVGYRPFSLTTGDFNGDGLIDLVTANGPSDDVSVLLGRGDGTFADDQRFSVGSFPSSVTTGDFNGDGLIDLVTADLVTANGYYSGNVSVLLGRGDGTFADDQRFSVGDGPRSVTTGDFNGDGLIDLVTANDHYSGDVSVLLGRGDGTFADDQRFSVGDGPSSVTTGDFNGDGLIDLVTANNVSDDVSVLLGRGDGTFADDQRFSVGSRPSSVTTGDFNGDGLIDLVTTNDEFPFSAASDVSVLLGRGDGTFAHDQLFSVGFRPRSVTTGDFNGDGLIDLVTANNVSDDVSVLLGRGDGTFADDQRFSVGRRPRSVTTGDFNGDGLIDLVTANDLYNDVSVLLGLGDGTFADDQRFSVGEGPSSVTTGDFNGDGIIDLATANRDSSDVSVLLGLAGSGTAMNFHPRKFTYDPLYSQLTSVTDELGRQTLNTLDPANGNHLATRQVVGQVDSIDNGETDDLLSTFTYTSRGQIDMITDPLGRITQFDYDPFGHIVQITSAVGTPDEALRTFEYDTAGNQTSNIDENGNRTQFVYDSMNRLTKITEADPDGPGPLLSPVSTFVYDARGILTETTDAAGSTLVNEYDTLDRPILRRDEQGNETLFTYDPDGNLVTITDPNGNQTRFTYDARNRRITNTDADGGVTLFGYDPNDNLLVLTDPNGNRTHFAYDARNRQVREVDPLGASKTFTYDAVNNLVKTTDRNGRVTSFDYDELDRLTREVWSNLDGSVANTIDRTYDKASNLLSITDNASALAFTYDARNRVTTVDNTGTLADTGLPGVVLSRTYDGVGNVTSTAEQIDGLPGATTQYQYDALNRMAGIQQSGTGVTEKLVDLAYNQIGQFERISRFSNLDRTNLVARSLYSYDELNRLVSLEHGSAADPRSLAFYDFEYDPASRITALTDIDGRTDYNYDNRDQLTGANRGAADSRGDENYTYDASGNRVESSLHGNGYVTGAANRLLSDGTYNYAYDAEGNMTLRTEIATGKYRQFEYDHRNRLTRVTDFSAGDVITQEVAFTYDALNRRIEKRVVGYSGAETSQHYFYNGDHVILEFDDSDGDDATAAPQLARRNLFGQDIDQILVVENVATAQNLWTLVDHLGTVRDLFSNDEVVLNRITYDSFGNVVSQTDAAFSTRYLFTGREFDSEIGLFYYRARYYNGFLGRFISNDPLKFNSGDFNHYRYVGNSPNSGIDPLGLLDLSKFTRRELERNLKRERAREEQLLKRALDLMGGIGQPHGGVSNSRSIYGTLDPFGNCNIDPIAPAAELQAIDSLLKDTRFTIEEIENELRTRGDPFP